MQRKLGMLVVLLAIAGIGAWSYQTRPAITPSPKTKIQTKTQTPTWVAEMDSQDQKDVAKANKLTPAEIAKIRKSSGQTEVRGMVKIRQDQLPATIVAGLHTTACEPIPASWQVITTGSDYVAQDGDAHGWSVGSGGVISIPSGAAQGSYYGKYDTGDDCGGGNTTINYYEFTITGDLTGSVSVTGQSYTTDSNTVSIALKADTATGLEVVSAAVSSGGGTGDTTTTPDVQHYTDSLTLTYDTEGDYTISVTYTDNQSPTANTLTVTTDIHVCFPDNTAEVNYLNYWGGVNVNPQLKLVRTSKTFDSGTGLYTSCYKVGISTNGTNFVTPDNQGIYFLDATWTLPDNATTSDDLTNNVGPINFCIQTATGEEADFLDQISCSTSVYTGFCESLISTPLFLYTLPTSATRTGAGGGFWMM